MTPPYAIVTVSVPDKGVAGKLADGIVKARLAACVNVVGPAASTYWWKGAVEKAEEYLLFIKTRADLFPEISEFVRKNHPYTVPEVLLTRIDQGLDSYLDWIGAHTRFTKPSERRERP